MRKTTPQDPRSNKPGFKKTGSNPHFKKDAKPSFRKKNEEPFDTERVDRNKKGYEARVSRKPGSSEQSFDREDRDKRDRKPGFKNNKDSYSDRSATREGYNSDKKFTKKDGYNSDSRSGKKFERPGKEEARPYKKFDRSEKDDSRSGKKFERPGKEEARPYKKFDRSEKDDSRAGRKFDRPGKEDARPYKKFDRSEKDDSRAGRKFDRPGKEDARPYKKFDRSEKADSRPYKKSDRDGQDDTRPYKKFDKAGKEDTRPFRQRGSADDTKGRKMKPGMPAGETEGEKKKTFRDVMNGAFQGQKTTKDKDGFEVIKPEKFDDKVFGELEDKYADKPVSRPYETQKLQKSIEKKQELTKGRKKKWEDEEEDEDDASVSSSDEMPLNKYIAHSGECSRRDAAEFVKHGKVKVNGELVLDPGYRVKQDDQVTMSGKKLVPQKGLVYILLNKPKGFITTNEDPQGRKTVMELVANSGVGRLFAVGRLDRDTTGLLLITNDGALTQKLSHPSYNIKKVYHVTLDKPLTKADFEKIVEGVELEDGKAVVDEIAYLEKKNEIGLEIHSGRNRIVRRIFESLGYVVDKLDRVMYAGLTKKNLPRSKWRFLNDREIVLLKHFKN